MGALKAKDESPTPGAGLQQALAYAVDVDAPFFSNGHGIAEQDTRTGGTAATQAAPLDTPIPGALIRLFREQSTETDVRRIGQRIQRRNGRVPHATLETLNVLGGDPRNFGQPLLTQPRCEPRSTKAISQRSLSGGPQSYVRPLALLHPQHCWRTCARGTRHICWHPRSREVGEPPS